MKLTKPIAALAALVLSGGVLFGTTVAANATVIPYPPVEECIPSEGSEAWDETVVDTEAYDETIIDSAAHWQRYSANGSWKEDFAPDFPSDVWQANVQGDPHEVGVAGPYFRSNENSGNIDWFYLEWVPEVSHVLHHDAVTHVVHHDAVPPVTCDPEAVPCAVSGDWYTEGDDVAPVETAEGLVFAGGSGDAVGYRHAVSGNLQGLAEIEYSATGDLDVFYIRIVINSVADDGYAYDSLTVISEGPINGSSVASSNKRGFITHTLDEWAALLPNNEIASIGFHLDSGATADQSVTLESFNGNCVSAEFGFIKYATVGLPVVKDLCETENDHYGLPVVSEGASVVRDGLGFTATLEDGYVWGEVDAAWTDSEGDLVFAFDSEDFTDVNCEQTVPVPALFAAEPTPPTCATAGSFDFSGEFPNVIIQVTPEVDGPGTYTLSGDTVEGFEFEDGTTHKEIEITILGQLVTQSTNPAAPCYLAPPVTDLPNGLAFTGVKNTLGFILAGVAFALIIGSSMILVPMGLRRGWFGHKMVTPSE